MDTLKLHALRRGVGVSIKDMIYGQQQMPQKDFSQYKPGDIGPAFPFRERSI